MDAPPFFMAFYGYYTKKSMVIQAFYKKNGKKPI